MLHFLNSIHHQIPLAYLFYRKVATDRIVDVRFAHSARHAVYLQVYLYHLFHPFLLSAYFSSSFFAMYLITHSPPITAISIAAAPYICIISDSPFIGFLLVSVGKAKGRCSSSVRISPNTSVTSGGRSLPLRSGRSCSRRRIFLFSYPSPV